MPKPKCESYEEFCHRTGRCPACEVVNVNGLRCHEAGCPEAWREERRSCIECGCDFKPERKHQLSCPDCEYAFESECLEIEAEPGDCDGISDDNWACGTLDPET